MSGNIDTISITTPLPDTSFLVSGFSGTEQLSRPFQYVVELDAGQQLLDPNSLLDKPATITLGNPGTRGRYISGIVSNVRQMPAASKTYWRYSLTIVPKLWFLGQTSDCRFWHNMTVPQIAEAILGKFDVTFENKLQGSYTTREYTVQFNESYLSFLQRILEDEGIFYFFGHTESNHSMVLADQKTAFQAIANPTLELRDSAVAWSDVTNFHREDSTALGQVTVDDYNAETDTISKAGQAVRGNETTVLKASGAAQRTHYQWPAVRGTNTDAGTRAKWRMLAAEGAAQMYRGTGGSPDFIAGGKFSITNDPNAVNDFVIHTVSYQVTDAATLASNNSRSQISMNFTAFPATADWHETPSVPAPVMGGMYTAWVIGPAGEEIYYDSFGRIQLWFPWDNQSDIQPEQTFWARVVQPWAGIGWGHQFIPRIGMEVAVAFLEGDVNRPVVVGSMYNSNNTALYPPAKKNVSGIRTRSTLKGGADNYNELSWDDTKGSEVFFLHAEKDYFLEVENDQTLKIDNCRIVTVTQDETVTINGKQSITVKGDRSLTVSQGKMATTVSTGDQENTVSTGNQTNTVSTGNQTIKVSTGNRAVTVSLGNETLDVSLGSITHKAMQSITLQVGGNSLKIDQTGITLTGLMIKINANAMLKLDAPMTMVAGDGLLKLSGGIAMIN